MQLAARPLFPELLEGCLRRCTYAQAFAAKPIRRFDNLGRVAYGSRLPKDLADQGAVIGALELCSQPCHHGSARPCPRLVAPQREGGSLAINGQAKPPDPTLLVHGAGSSSTH